MRVGQRLTNDLIGCNIDPMGGDDGYPTAKECQMIGTKWKQARLKQNFNDEHDNPTDLEAATWPNAYFSSTGRWRLMTGTNGKFGPGERLINDAWTDPDPTVDADRWRDCENVPTPF